MKKIGNILLWIYGFIANLITYITGLETTLEFLNRYIPAWFSYLIIILNVFLFVFLAFYGPILLAIYATLPYRKRIGTHRIECKPFNMFIYRFLNKNGKLLKVVHRELYHRSYKLKEEIRKGHILEREQLQEKITEFLKYVGLSLRDIFNLSLSINVKLLSYSSDEALFLSPYIQIQQENNEIFIDKERNLTYKYIILLDNSTNLQKACSDAKHYNDHDNKKTYCVNSIFNFLMNSQIRHWMSNDLSKDMSKGIFYTSSENYPTHYKSMAVFKIMPPERNVLSEGLLIFDTNETGRFVEEECSQLMGFVAHLLYEFFLEYNYYEQKKKTERKQTFTPNNSKRKRTFRRS